MPSADDCDEGGTHEYQLPHETSCCGWIGKCLCLPCTIFCSCALSGGAAGANQVGFRGEEDVTPGELACRKCGLTPSEASALSGARQVEMSGSRTSKGTGYFTNEGMKNPSSGAPPSPRRSEGHRSPGGHSPRPSGGSNEGYPPQESRGEGGGARGSTYDGGEYGPSRASQQPPPRSPRNASPAERDRNEGNPVGSWLSSLPSPQQLAPPQDRGQSRGY